GVTAPFAVVAFACVLGLTACGGSVYKLGDAPDGGDAGEGGAAQASEVGNSGCGGGGCNGNGSSNGGGNGSGFVDEGGSATIGADDGGSGSTTGYEDASVFSADGGATGVSGPSCAAAPVACSGGAIGYACTSGNPEEDSQVSLSCTSGQIEGYAVDYCCFPWAGTGGPCAPYPDFPCGGSSYAYQCVPGTTPPSVEPKLSCGTNFPDSNGNNDFCCTYQ
ncbi:MAG TPA: hypothetical protein VIY73_07965, partial [Polyangiaceae bacterium]